MIPSGLTSLVINRASLGDRYVRVRDSGLITAIAQFLYDEAALLDEWRLDEWLALFHPEAAKYQVPSPEDLSDDPATTLHLVNDSMTTLAGRIGRLKSNHGPPHGPPSRTRRQSANVRVWRGPDDLLSRSASADRAELGQVGSRGCCSLLPGLLPDGNSGKSEAEVVGPERRLAPVAARRPAAEAVEEPA